MHIGQTAPTFKPARDALAGLHAALVEASRHRPLTRAEIRLRCMTKPRPWRDLGIDRSTWYRRRKRERIAAEIGVSLDTVNRARNSSDERFRSPEREGQDGKSYSIRQRMAEAV
jgi:hypothetical protein